VMASSPNLDLVRSIYAAWGRGHVKTVRPGTRTTALAEAAGGIRTRFASSPFPPQMADRLPGAVFPMPPPTPRDVEHVSALPCLLATSEYAQRWFLGWRSSTSS
jgi:hypothetical protein